MIRKLLSSFIIITLPVATTFAATAVRSVGNVAAKPIVAPLKSVHSGNVSGGAVGTARTASAGGTRVSSAPKLPAGGSARLSVSKFLDTGGKYGGPVLGSGSANLSAYATNERVDSLESRLDRRIDDLDLLKVEMPDVYTKDEIDEMISAGGQGGQGAAGPAGPTGPQGPAGASAYEVAVSNGFTGTQAEWLASLVGSGGGLPTAATDGIYILSVENGETSLQPVTIATGSYQE